MSVLFWNWESVISWNKKQMLYELSKVYIGGSKNFITFSSSNFLPNHCPGLFSTLDQSLQTGEWAPTSKMWQWKEFCKGEQEGCFWSTVGGVYVMDRRSTWWNNQLCSYREPNLWAQLRAEVQTGKAIGHHALGVHDTVGQFTESHTPGKTQRCRRVGGKFLFFFLMDIKGCWCAAETKKSLLPRKISWRIWGWQWALKNVASGWERRESLKHLFLVSSPASSFTVKSGKTNRSVKQNG